ncbi:MAG: hypothetical protein U1B80_07875 [Anaerolineaceae bacterium]|nr:hypothetical protein [Anaerolineaceae bacterium]
MAKKFLTAKDVDEHADRGVMEIQINDEVVITDFGRERALERGVKIIRLAPGAPLPAHPPCCAGSREELHAKVRAAVIAKLGGTPENLDVVIRKALNGLK